VLNNNREGNKQLRRPSLEVETHDPDVKLLIARMLVTLKKADGVGIAAPQVGINRRVIVVQRLDQEGQPYVAYMNPEITRFSRTMVTDWEGCLSVPAGYGRVERASAIHVAFDQPDGTRAGVRVQGFTARIFQHEIDHLDGVLFIDRMREVNLISREEMVELRRRLREQAAKEAAEKPESPDEPK
jgi:peptide deformylase